MDPYQTAVIDLVHVFDVLKYLAYVWGNCLEPLVLELQLNKQETLNMSMPTMKPTHHEHRLEFISSVSCG